MSISHLLKSFSKEFEDYCKNDYGGESCDNVKTHFTSNKLYYNQSNEYSEESFDSRDLITPDNSIESDDIDSLYEPDRCDVGVA